MHADLESDNVTKLLNRYWGAQVRKAADATYMYPASGSSLNIRCRTLLAFGQYPHSTAT